MLKTILIITISVSQLGPVESAYRDHLGYETVERGAVSMQLGSAWNASGMVDRDYLLMQPASQAPVYLRFIRNDDVPGYAPMATHGWNATEVLVTNPDTLAERLIDSPFQVIGPPADLWVAPDAPRALQALGPGNEVLYLTRNGNFAIETFVDRVFIMVLGGPSMAAMAGYYRDTFGLEVGEPMPFPITVVSRAQGKPADTIYPLAVAAVSSDFLLELDEYPADIPPRPVTDRHLPPGVSMVTFEYDGELDDLDVQWRTTPREIDAFPYAGREVGVTTGAAGEWIELVEAAAKVQSPSGSGPDK